MKKASAPSILVAMSIIIFVPLLATVMLTTVSFAEAQQAAKVPRIGVLSSFAPSGAAVWHQAFQEGLRDLGWVEGKNIAIEYRYSEGRADRLPELATDLVVSTSTSLS